MDNGNWKLGCVAELRVVNPRVLDNPTMHRIPNMMMVERGRWEVARLGVR